jgi:hypothetical protein
VEDKNMEVLLEVLHIDTTTTHAAWYREEDKSNKQKEATASDNASIEGSSLATVCVKGRTTINSDWYISLRDPRFFRSLLKNLRHAKQLQVEISSTGGHKGTASEGIYSNACGQQKPTGNLYYVDDIISTAFNSNSQANDVDRDGFKVEAPTMKRMWLWHYPPIPTYSDWAHLYISIQDETRTESLQQGTTTSTQLTATSLPDFVHVNAQTLHLRLCLVPPKMHYAEKRFSVTLNL